MLSLCAILAGLLMPLGTVAAGANNVAFVNGAGSDITTLSIRRSGTKDWRAIDFALAVGKAGSAGLSDPDCAFDLKATLANGKTVTWAGVNLCDAKLLTLRQNAAGLAWVDYD